MPPAALTSLNTDFTALSSVMPSSPTGPLAMRNPPSLMVSAVTPTSVAPPLPPAGAAVDGPVADGPPADGRVPDPVAAAAAGRGPAPVALPAGVVPPDVDPAALARPPVVEP